MSMISCPECGHPVSSRAQQCPGCGVAIADNVKRCPKCRGFALMDATICPTCGAHFILSQPLPPHAEWKEARVDDAEVQEELQEPVQEAQEPAPSSPLSPSTPLNNEPAIASEPEEAQEPEIPSSPLSPEPPLDHEPTIVFEPEDEEPAQEEAEEPASPSTTLTPVAPLDSDSAIVPEPEEAQESEPLVPAPFVPEEQPTSPPPAKSNRKKIIIWCITLILLIVGFVTAFIFWKGQGQAEAAEKEFIELKSGHSHSLVRMQDYLNKYPKSPHVEEVKAMMQELQSEDNDWAAAKSKAQNDGNSEALNAFMNKYPNSPNKREADTLIDSLDFVDACTIAESQNSPEALEIYKRRHPAGAYLDDAEHLITELNRKLRFEEERQRALLKAREDSIAAAQESMQIDVLDGADVPLPM